MARMLATALAAASLGCLALAPGAKAMNLDESRAVAHSQPPPSAHAATISPSIAPPATCPGQSSPSSTLAAQEQAMLCLINFARVSLGLGELAGAHELELSAEAKASDVLRCDSFSHFACGREFTYWIRLAGYIGEGCWHAGENLAWGLDQQGSAREIFRAWMSSPTHRRNVLGEYSQIGLGLLSGHLEGHRGARVWSAHFGSRCAG